jgi:putative transposase
MYETLAGALKNLGHKIGRNTIKRILQENGIDPAPERGKRMSWATFIKAHLGVLVGMDSFTVEAVTWLGLVRYHVLFAIDIASRKVEILGMVANPGGPWVEQMARNLVDAVDGFLVGKRYVLIDRDPLYTEAFRRILGQGGVKALRLPARSPNLKGFASYCTSFVPFAGIWKAAPLFELATL